MSCDFDEIHYFDVKHALKEHDSVIKKSGGVAGVKHINLLESVLGHIKNDVYYSTLIDKLTHLMFSINKNHAFNDGNKRASLVLSGYFLEINGYEQVVTRLMTDLEEVAVWVAENRIDKPLLAKILECVVYEFEYSDELKKEIDDALIRSVFDVKKS
jgi:death-on-curing protein